MNCVRVGRKKVCKPPTKSTSESSSSEISPSVPSNDILRYAKMRKKNRAEVEKHIMQPHEIEFVNAIMAKHLAYAKSKRSPPYDSKQVQVVLDAMKAHYKAAAEAKEKAKNAAKIKPKSKSKSKSDAKTKSDGKAKSKSK
jgi:hypothetical protein